MNSPATSPPNEDTVEVNVTNYSERGHGTIRLAPSGKALPVIGSVSGDRLRVTLLGRRKRVRAALLKEVLSPSPDRVTPRCSHVGTCGGCTWQQLAYAAQVEQKQHIVHTLFDPLPQTATLHPMIACPSPWAYRNKMEFSFSQDRANTRFLGLNSPLFKGKVIDLAECHLVSPWFTRVLQQIRLWWEESGLCAYHFHRNTGTLRTLTLREGKRTREKMIILTVSGNHNDFLNQRQLNSYTQAVLASLPNETPSIFLRIHRAKKGTPSDFYEMHLWGNDTIREEIVFFDRHFHFHISPSSFFQPHPTQAEKLFRRAFELASPSPSDRVYDLYCGGAVGGILFAPFVHKVIGIESNPYAVCDAQRNIEANKITNLSVIRGDVGDVLTELHARPDLVLTDPPRAGMDKASLTHLIRLNAPKILYISCHPKTQKRDIEILCQHGYQLRALQPVDQFPHTPHIENIAYLARPESPLGSS